MKLYSVCDSVAEEYGPVFEAKNDDVAKRSFKQILDKSSVSPADFELCCIGEFDHETGAAIFDFSVVCDGDELFKQPELDFDGGEK